MGAKSAALSRWRRTIWPGVAVLALALVPFDVWLGLLSGERLFTGDVVPSHLVLVACYALIGLLICSKQPTNNIGHLACLIGLSTIAGDVVQAYAHVGLLDRPGSLPGAAFASWCLWLYYPGYVALLIWLPLRFPDGKPPFRWWRPVNWAGWAILAAVGLEAVLLWPIRGIRLLDGTSPQSSFPIAAQHVGTAVNWAFRLVPWLALASLVTRYVRSDRATRVQIRWFVIAAVSIGVTALENWLHLPGWLEGFRAVPWVPFALLVAMNRHQLFGIELIVRRSLVLTGLTVGVVGVYTAVVAGASALLGVSGLGPSLVATALVAVLFQPARDLLQRGAEKLVYGRRRDPHLALSQLGRHLQSSVGRDEGLPAIAETVVQALRLPYVRIDLAGDHGPGEAGTRVGGVATVALVHRREYVGELTVGLRSGERRLDNLDRRVVDELAPLVATAVHAMALTAEVRRSRERLVVAREEERRRLRRDIHDGLGPALAGIAMEIQAARNLMEAGDGAVVDVLTSAEGRTRDAIIEVRRVVYALRPPVLDQLGLLRALEEHASSVSGPMHGDGLVVSVEADGELASLPAGAEVAAYLIVLEALTNVLRHADARRCQIRLVADEELLIEVNDDGIGLPDGASMGVGLSSMRERAEELGGTLSLDASAMAGLCVVARIPLESA